MHAFHPIGLTVGNGLDSTMQAYLLQMQSCAHRAPGCALTGERSRQMTCGASTAC